MLIRSLFLILFTFITTLHATDIILFEGKQMQIVLPAYPLFNDSVKIESKLKHHDFADWTNDENQEVYALTQKIIAMWKDKGINDYLIVGQEDSEKEFSWEIVPYPHTEHVVWNQFKVFSHFLYSYGALSESERQTLQKEYADKKNFLMSPYSFPLVQEIPKGTDAFCNSKIIDLQYVIDDPQQDVRVLYNYFPITHNDFLVVTKKHVVTFAEMSPEEYLQAINISQELVKKLRKEGSSIYFYNKTGKIAGQTVPHWHMHVIITGKNESLYILKIIMRMLGTSTPLKPDELQKIVLPMRQELNVK